MMSHHGRIFLGVLLCVGITALGRQGLGSAPSAPVGSLDDLPCSGAAFDDDVWWVGLRHDSFDADYRSPFGAVEAGSREGVRIRFRTCAGDADQVRLRIWDDALDRESWLSLQPTSFPVDDGRSLGLFNYWEAVVPVPSHATILYYGFEIRDGTDVDYYYDDDVRLLGGGPGRALDERADRLSYQLTVFERGFSPPEWLQGATVYQIFPDRFHNADPSNDPRDGQGFVYGLKNRLLEWSEPLCDPLTPACREERHNFFYGGDLAGITSKLDYLQSLGVTALYLNPIFQAPSNHRYDTQNHMRIDPTLGTRTQFERLVREARSRGMRLILDGVFNHVSSDSAYFDLYNRWNASGDLTSPNHPGADDGSGACESPRSPYRSWFWIPHRHHAGRSGGYPGRVLTCPRVVDEANEWPQTYESWFGYASLPKLNTAHPDVRRYFIDGGRDAVGPHWIHAGASAWRLDVGGDVDAGATIDPGNTFWEEFRAAVKAASPDAALIGEEWGDGSPWLLGREWDSVMNYRFRSAALSWLSDGCRGKGCTAGSVFQDNDSNSHSHSGPITPLSGDEFVLRLKSLLEDYPEPTWHAMLNLTGSHDTNRLRFLLRKVSLGDDALALRKMRLYAALQFTFPGAPTVYYGDEVAASRDGVWDGSTWQDDPYNRIAFPWPGTDLERDESMLVHLRRLGELRRTQPALRRGGIEFLDVGSGSGLVAFRRYLEGGGDVLVVLNRRARASRLRLRLSEYFEKGTFLRDALGDLRIRVAEGMMTVGPVPGFGATVLIRDPAGSW